MGRLSFVGTAHPAPTAGQRKHQADYNSAEIALQKLHAETTPVHVEHEGAPVGSVLTSWVDKRGALKVQGVVHDPAAARDVRGGKLRELSLGQTLDIDPESGNVLNRATAEVSLVAQGARSGCHIESIDGQRVRQVACFSKSARAPSLTLTPNPSLSD